MKELSYKDVSVGNMIQHMATRRIITVSVDVISLMIEGEKYVGVKVDKEILHKYGFDIFTTDPRAELLVQEEGQTPVFFRVDVAASTLIVVAYNNMPCKCLKIDGFHDIQRLYRLFTKKDLALVR